MPAIIGKPAPAFKAQAVVDGDIKEVSLDDFKGGPCVAQPLRASSRHQPIQGHQ